MTICSTSRILATALAVLAGSTALASAAQVSAIARLSANAAGVAGNYDSREPTFSSDGAHVAFTSWADNLVAGDGNGVADVFNKNIWTGAIERVTDSCCNQPNDQSFGPAYTPDGRGLAFSSAAANLVNTDTNAGYDVFLRSLTSPSLRRIATNGANRQLNKDSWDVAFSPDGRSIAFTSTASNVVAGDLNATTDVFVKDLAGGETRRVSVGATGRQAYAPSDRPVFLPDGKSVAFFGSARELLPGGWRQQVTEVYIKRLDTGAIRRACTNALGEQLSDGCAMRRPSFTPNGRYMVFATVSDNVIARDTGGRSQIYLKDLVTGRIKSLCTTSAGKPADGSCHDPQLSPDGKRVAFTTDAGNLGAGWRGDVVVKDLATGVVSKVSTTPDGVQADGSSGAPVFSPDGTMIAFTSSAANLVAGAVPGIGNIYVVWMTP